jgi:hypothetical protein
MATVDVRDTLDVTAIQFADDYELVGSSSENLLAIRKISTNQAQVIASKAMVDDLVAALQLSKRFW